MIKILVAGAKGKMGQRVIAFASESDDLKVAAEYDYLDDLSSKIPGCDIVIDFSTAAATPSIVSTCAKAKLGCVIGTTGHTAEQITSIREAARIIPILYSPNMSIGVNLMSKLVEDAARTLGIQFRIEIDETHHIHKLDRPSGTAKKLINSALAGRADLSAADVAQFEETRPPSEHPDLSVLSMRRGEVVGDHEARFVGTDEILTISHRAISRDIFARGALTAARWIVHKTPGLYTMDDVLGLK